MLAPFRSRPAHAAPSHAVDVVALLDADTRRPVLETARPTRANVFEISRVMEHPLEDGSTIVDHMVRLPVEVDLVLVSMGSPQDVYAELSQLHRAGTLLTVQTRTGTYDSMLLAEIPHDEPPEMAESVTFALRLKEAKFVQPEYGQLPPRKVANPAHSSTVKRGTQQTTEASPSKTDAAKDTYRGSILYRVFN